jgi:hypothetical protein
VSEEDRISPPISRRCWKSATEASSASSSATVPPNATRRGTSSPTSRPESIALTNKCDWPATSSARSLPTPKRRCLRLNDLARSRKKGGQSRLIRSRAPTGTNHSLVGRGSSRQIGAAPARLSSRDLLSSGAGAAQNGCLDTGRRSASDFAGQYPGLPWSSPSKTDFSLLGTGTRDWINESRPVRA